MIEKLIKTSIYNFKKYFVTQFKIFLIILLFFVVSLNVISVPQATVIGIGIAILDIIPILGSGMVFIPWSIYEWGWGSPDFAWKLALIYIVSIIIKQILEPIFIGKDLSLPFFVPIIITIICGMVFNVFGVIVAAFVIPIVSAIFQIIKHKSDDQTT